MAEQSGGSNRPPRRDKPGGSGGGTGSGTGRGPSDARRGQDRRGPSPRPDASNRSDRSERSTRTERPARVERPRIQAPELPEGITPGLLDEDVQAELRSLTKENADVVASHLAAAAMLLDEDPEASYQHAVYARARASRVGSVREAMGIAAYLTGRYAESLSELRAVRRIHGSDVHLPVMADCQRGLGRPERALEMAGSPEAAGLDAAGQVEMRIVAAGARQDLGQFAAAVLTLQCPELRDAKAPWAPRLRYAYAEALLLAGRDDEGRDWMSRAVDADRDAETEAAERLAELDGVSFVETADEAGDDDLEGGPETKRTET